MLSEGVSDRHIEIMRGDLAEMSTRPRATQVEYIFDDSIATLQDNGSRVEVTFERGGPRTFDLRRRRRRPAFDDPPAGLRPSRSRSRGSSAATSRYSLCPTICTQDRMVGFTVPGERPGCTRSVTGARLERCSCGAHPDCTTTTGTTSTPSDGCCATCTATSAGRCRGCSPIDRADDLYLDSISQVVMDAGPSGRVALVGDAGYSPGASGRRRHQPGDHRGLRPGQRTRQGWRRSRSGFRGLPAGARTGGSAQPARSGPPRST